MIPGYFLNSRYRNPEVVKCPGKDTREFSISGYFYTQIEKYLGSDAKGLEKNWP